MSLEDRIRKGKQCADCVIKSMQTVCDTNCQHVAWFPFNKGQSLADANLVKKITSCDAY